MRKKLLFALATALIATLIVATPAFAWTGVSGVCIDDLTLQGWASGGVVEVYGSSSGLIASGPLSMAAGHEGEFNVTWTPETADTTLYIVIKYNTGPQGTPGTYIEDIPNIPGAGNYYMGYIKTDSGPNAVTLADVNAQSPSQWLLAALAAVALVGVGTAVLLFRKRQVA